MRLLLILLFSFPSEARWWSESQIDIYKAGAATSRPYGHERRCLDAESVEVCHDLLGIDPIRIKIVNDQIVNDPAGDVIADAKEADQATRTSKEVTRLNAIESCSRTKPSDMTALQNSQCTVSMAIQFMKNRLATGDL